MLDNASNGWRGGRRSASAIAAILIGAIVGLPPVAASVEQEAPPSSGRLQIDGSSVIDEHGRVVLLHGMNLVAKRPPFVMIDAPGSLSAAEAERLAAQGFNNVRLGVTFSGLMPTKGVIDVGYLDLVAQAVDLLGDHDISVLLDLHQDLYAPPWSDYDGFPPWAVPLHIPIAQAVRDGVAIDSVLGDLGVVLEALPLPPEVLTIGQLAALEPNLGFPLNGTRPSSLLAWDFFWGNGRLDPADPQGVVDYLGDSLVALAERLGDHPAVMGIEFINEAIPGTLSAACLAHGLVAGCPEVDAYFQAAYQQFTDRIRAVAGPDLPLWWEVNVLWNFYVPSAFGNPLLPPLPDGQVGITFHQYCNTGVACDVEYDREFANADALAARTGRALIASEFGFSTDPAVLAPFLARADRRLMHWQFWDYGNAFEPHQPGEAPLAPAQLDQLVRTYPQATAGVPRSLTFDPATGETRFTYTPRQLDAPTDIYVSNRHYPDGYEVAVSGARVTSPPCARHVTLEAPAGAVTVSVVIRDGACGTVVSDGPDDDPTAPSDQGSDSDRLPATGSYRSTLLAAALFLLAVALRRFSVERTDP